MKKQGKLLLELSMLAWICRMHVVLSCWEGEYLYTPGNPQAGDVCLPCKNGSFMSETDHTNRECNACSKNTSHLEIIITPCNRTRDTEIHCVSGYYRRKAQTALEKDRCVECRNCEYRFPARPCLGYNDTVCCPLQHDAVWTCEGQYECKERPAPCGAGMYYNTTFDTCLSCPNGTYMQAHHHATRECLKCAALSGNSSNHATILQPCTRNSPTVFGCEDFYFRVSDSGSLLEEAPCSPCQKCRREIRQCQILHDAICTEDSRQDNDSSEDTGTSGMIDMIKQLNATFSGSLHNCLLDCMTDGFATLQASIAQSESGESKCVSSCFPEIHNANIVSAWLHASLNIILFILFSWVIWRMPKKNVEANNFRNTFLNVRLFTCVLFVLNAGGVILLIIGALLKSMVIEHKGYGGVAIEAYCCIIYMSNLVLIFMNNVKPKNLHRRSVDIVEEKFDSPDTEEMKSLSVPAKSKQSNAFILLQTEKSSSCSTAGWL